MDLLPFNGGFEKVDNFNFGPLEGETILLRNYAWHFILKPYRSQIQKRILNAVLYAQYNGSNVIGLGALTKAEWLTKGGLWITEALGDRLKIPVVHGDTLTSVTVIEQAKRALQKGMLDGPVLITGGTSKIGRAVALALAQEGITVLMLTKSKKRFEQIKSESSKPNKVVLCHNLNNKIVKSSRLWITGKAIPGGLKLLSFIPDGAKILNFSVPNPLADYQKKNTRGITFEECGLLGYDTDLNHFNFNMRLKPGITYACHAGTMVHAKNGWSHNEVGHVHMDTLEEVWDSARALGFFLPE